ncbi:MAG: methyltransferase domain-containing protein [Pseudomonadota bacterium]
MASDQSAGHHEEYDDGLVARLELLWGEGFLSPGGAEEVALLLSGVDLTGKAVLDIGCGIGGVDLLLARDHGAASVLGIDVEAPLIRRARDLAERAGLAERIAYRQVEPGPLPLEDGSFDVVFSKDAMIHIPDKAALFAEVRRVLRPGGSFIASDWLQSAEGRGAPEMTQLGEALGLTFNLATPAEMVAAMCDAGFQDVALTDRNAWYRDLVVEEQTRISGAIKEQAIAALGQERYDRWVAAREIQIVAVAKGYLRPTHLRGWRG